MNFHDVSSFFESWGLHFDSQDGDSTDIPYPQVYERMRLDAKSKDNDLYEFAGLICQTTDGRTYLNVCSIEELEQEWFYYSSIRNLADTIDDNTVVTIR